MDIFPNVRQPPGPFPNDSPAPKRGIKHHRLIFPDVARARRIRAGTTGNAELRDQTGN